MGLAKYHEDNMELWEERNRYRREWTPTYSLNHSFDRIKDTPRNNGRRSAPAREVPQLAKKKVPSS